MSEDQLPQWATDRAREALQDPRVGRAMDILRADRVPDDRIGQFVLACIADGRDPEAAARHFVKLRQALR